MRPFAPQLTVWVVATVGLWSVARGEPSNGRSLPIAKGPISEPALRVELFERCTRFVDWPNEPNTYVVGLLGSSRSEPYLRRLAQERALKGRPVEFRRLEHVQGASEVHALWIGTGLGIPVQEVLDRVAGQPVLVVADEPQWVKQGAHLGFEQEQGRLQLLLNVRTSHQSGLRLSAQLMQVAQVINGDWTP